MSTPLDPSLLKRLLAAFYDGILILATVFFAIALTLPFTKGEIAADNNIYMSLYLLVVVYIFYGWFWTHGGQTLGMRVWKQQLVSYDGTPVNWQQTFIRVLTGLPAWGLFLIGIILWMVPDKIVLSGWVTSIPKWLFALTGFTWVLFDIRSNNWRDKLSGTHIILIEKEDVSA
ncbi:MAG: RDD family protein [Gammaproteobacteria bacterium]|nr:RDD family protein [Gammaproteobacteria bacterium]